MLHAATKQYVDGQVATALPRAGGVLSGPLTLSADPTASLQAATKQYADTRVSRTGDTLTGPLVLAGDPAVSMQAATKHYVDVQLTGLLPISGGALTGALTLPSNPSTALQAATKQYVDSQITTTMPIAGGTLTGPLTLAADPTLSLQAATKRYVDSTGAAANVINVKASPYNAKINGTADDTAAFKAAYQAAPAGSVIYCTERRHSAAEFKQLGHIANKTSEVDRRWHFIARWHATCQCNSGWRWSGQQFSAGPRDRQQWTKH